MSAPLIDSFTREPLAAGDVETEARYHRDADAFARYVASGHTDLEAARAEHRRLQIKGSLWQRLAEHAETKNAAELLEQLDGERPNSPATN